MYPVNRLHNIIYIICRNKKLECIYFSSEKQPTNNKGIEIYKKA